MSKFAEMVRDQAVEIARRKPKDPRPWKERALPHQTLPDGDWRVFSLVAGRGVGKTHAGAETVNEWARELPGSRGILVGRTASDVRGTMLEGPAGLCTLYPDIEYEPSKQRITWPNGTVAQLLYAESPHMLRGPQCHWFWADEISSWSDANLGDREDTAWNNLMMGCRLTGFDGWKAKGIATFTPKPNPLVIAVINHPRTVVKTASTYDNPYLDEDSQQFFRETYEGSRIARQEIHGELLLEAANALWNTDELDAGRVKEHPDLVKIAVGWDPATTSGEHSDEHGIIAVGVDVNSHGYVLEDASGRMTPDKAALKVVEVYRRWNANTVVFEKNQGGDFVPVVLRAAATGVPNIGVHAKNGKRLRAEPVQARYQQGRVHHVGVFHKLESQMTTWDPDDLKMKSPDRVDAMVYALTWCFEGEGGLARQSFRIGFRRR